MAGEAAFDPMIAAGEGVPLRPEEPKFELPRITADDAGFAAYEKLSPGTRFQKPGGEIETKPYEPKNDEDFLRIPEGELFLKPNGERKRKPKYEGISMTAETLYNMARSPEAKRDALGVIYGPENVQDDYDGEPFVVDGTVKRKPGRSTVNAVAGHIAADLPKAGFSVGGGLLGAMAGPVTAAAGAGLGLGLADAFEDGILALAGVHQGSLLDQAKDIGTDMLWGAGGQGVGEVLPVIARGAVNIAKDTARQGGKIVGKFLGADKATPEEAEMARRLSKQGFMVLPDLHLKDAPKLSLLTRNFAEKFSAGRRERVNTAAYDERTDSLFKALGIDTEGMEKPTATTKPASSQKAGEAIIARYNSELAAADKKLDTHFQLHKNRVVLEGKSEAESLAIHRANLEQAAREAQAAAQKVVDAEMTDLRATVDQMAQRARRGGNAGELAQQFSDKLKGLRAALQTRSQARYAMVYEAAGAAKPEIGSLLDDVHGLLNQLPEGFEGKYPEIIRRLRGLEEGEAGFAQLHMLRTMLRHDIVWDDPASNFKNGALKRVAGAVDEVLHQAIPRPQGPVRLKDPNEMLPRYGREKLEGPRVDPRTLPEGLEKAARLLDESDAWYGKTQARFKDATFQAIVKGAEAGMPLDAVDLAKMLHGASSGVRNQIRKSVGPSLWAGVQAAETQAMLDASKLTGGGFDGAEFSRLVVGRIRNGWLDTTTPALAAQAEKVADGLALVEGRLKIDARPGDTVATLLEKAQVAEAEATLLAKQDPLGVMRSEVKRLDSELAAQTKGLRTEGENAPFHWLEGKLSAAGAKSADKILADEGLLVAAGVRFGEGSREFELLRQVAAMRIFQRTLQQTKTLREDFKGISEEAQNLVFPGVKRDLAVQLAKDMEFLMKGDSGMAEGMSALSRVNNPIPGTGGGLNPVKATGIAMAGRTVLNQFYQLMLWGTTHPAFIEWVHAGLRAGPVERQRVAEAVRKVWGAAGAGGAAIVNQERK